MQFIFRYWIIFVLSGAFCAGYYLRGLQYDASQKITLISQANKNTKLSENFEGAREEIDRLYENIKIEATYADSYNCIIPADGLQLLKQATR